MSGRQQVSAGFLHQSTAQHWIDEVRPLAVPLVTAPASGVDPGIVRVRAREAESLDDAPHGAFMLTWPQRTEHEAVINHLADCRPFLGLYNLLLHDLPDEGRPFQAVLKDGTRLRIAITNDVLQVLATGPSGTYSMIRHHALMFFVAHLWLPIENQPVWGSLYHSSVGLAARRYRASDAFGHPRRYLDELERGAFAALDRLAANLSRADAAPKPSDPDTQLVLSYMHAANAAVAVLIDAYDAVTPKDRPEWLVSQLAVGYREDAFLVDAWAAMTAS